MNNMDYGDLALKSYSEEYDLDHAIELLHHSVEINEHPWSKNKLADLLIERGNATDIELALNLLMRDPNDSWSVARIAKLRMVGVGLGKDIELATKELEIAAEHGVTWAVTDLLDLTYNQQVSDEKLYSIVNKYVVKNHPAALGYMGLLKFLGIGCVKNIIEALSYLYKASIKESKWLPHYYLAVAESKSIIHRDNLLKLCEKLPELNFEKHLCLARFYSNPKLCDKHVKESLDHYLNIIDDAPELLDEVYTLLLNENSSECLTILKELINKHRYTESTQILIAKLYYNGVLLEKDQDKAKHILKQCPKYHLKSDLNPTLVINPKLFQHHYIMIWSDDAYRLTAACLQYNIMPDGYCGIRNDNTITPICENYRSVATICKSDDVALLISAESYELCKQQYCNLEEYVSVYVEGTHAGTRSNELYIPNPALLGKELITLSDHKSVESDNLIIINQNNYKKIIPKLKTWANRFNILLDCDNWKEIIDYYKNDYSTLKGIYIDVQDKLITKLMCSKSFNGSSIDAESITEIFNSYYLGKHLYRELQSNSSEHYIYQQYGGMGDEYRRLGRANSYAKFHNYPNVTVIVRDKALDLPHIYAYKHIIVTDFEAQSLSRYIFYNLAYDEGNVRIVSSWILNNSLAGTLSLPLGEEYGDRLSKDLGIPAGTEYDPLICEGLSKKVVQTTNAILLNPYAKTTYKRMPHLEKIYFDLFRKLSISLSSEGFKVFTNVVDDTQEVLPGSDKIYYSILELCSMCEYYRHIVTVETGIAELFSQSQANLTIINHKKDDNYVLKIAKFNNHTNFWNYKLNEVDYSLEEEILSKVMDTIRNTEPVKMLQSTTNPIDYPPLTVLPKDTLCTAWKNAMLDNVDYYLVLVNKLYKRLKSKEFEKYSDELEEIFRSRSSMEDKSRLALLYEKGPKNSRDSNKSNLWKQELVIPRFEESKTLLDTSDNLIKPRDTLRYCLSCWDQLTSITDLNTQELIVHNIQSLAKQGDLNGVGCLALIYWQGIYFTKNKKEARKLIALLPSSNIWVEKWKAIINIVH